jgi:MerR family mercuric resistance operon transcriptional regulator
MNELTIGDVAKQAQVNIETLRYYERRGLLKKPPRSDSNYRLYPEDAVKRVRFIRRAQVLGFTLKEIGELLSLRATAGAGCEAVRQRADEKIADVNEKIRTLEAMRTALAKLTAQCSGQGPITDCPILETLDSENDL